MKLCKIFNELFTDVKFHLYNFVSLIGLLTAKGCKHILIFNNT